MSLFRHFALNDHRKATLNTLKSYCFALGAWKVNHANKRVLKISLPIKRRTWLDGIFSQIKILALHLNILMNNPGLIYILLFFSKQFLFRVTCSILFPDMGNLFMVEIEFCKTKKHSHLI